MREPSATGACPECNVDAMKILDIIARARANEIDPETAVDQIWRHLCEYD